MSQRNSIIEKIKNADLLSFTSISVGATLICAVLCIISLFFQNRKELISGFLFGLIFSIINFRLLKSAIERSVYKEDAKKASAYVTSQYMIRYVIKFAVLAVGFVSPLFSATAVIIGLMSVSIAIHLLNLINTKKLNKE